MMMVSIKGLSLNSDNVMFGKCLPTFTGNGPNPTHQYIILCYYILYIMVSLVITMMMMMMMMMMRFFQKGSLRICLPKNSFEGWWMWWEGVT